MKKLLTVVSVLTFIAITGVVGSIDTDRIAFTSAVRIMALLLPLWVLSGYIAYKMK